MTVETIVSTGGARCPICSSKRLFKLAARPDDGWFCCSCGYTRAVVAGTVINYFNPDNIRIGSSETAVH